jgi:cysteine desulfurase/selenocysteine lyase
MKPAVPTMTEVRALFPGVCDQVYLDASLRGLVPTSVVRAAEAHLRERLLGTGEKAAFQASVESARARFAALIGAHADEVAITKNVSEGLNLFASSLPWRASDNVVLCPDLEHPNNVFHWYGLHQRRGVEVRRVEPADGHVPVDALAAAVDARTRVVSVPHVTFSPGFVADVRCVADAAHAHDALVLVDAAQSAGAVAVDVDALGADALAVATQKCLLALYGFGFLYVRRAVAESIVPAQVARYGMDLGAEAGETARREGDLPLAPGARRFDLGNYNYLGARAAEAALALIADIGVDRIEERVRTLAARLASGLLDLGLPVVGGAPGPHLAHIVAVGRSGGGHHDTTDDPETSALYGHLTAHGVRLSVRRGVLRLSVAVYNDEGDIDRVLELARGWREAGG